MTEALKPIKNADRQRTRYLDISQRRELLAVVEQEAAPFVKALCLLPLRPGAMASLSARDFDKRTRVLTILPVGKDRPESRAASSCRKRCPHSSLSR